MGLRTLPFLAFALLWSTTNAGCPTMCQCSDKLVSCIAELLEGVPNFESLEVEPEAIDLSGNSIFSIDATDFSFDGNTYVQYLNLSNNHIVDINEKAFSELTNVREISLNANSLDSVPPMFVADNKRLVSLDLSNNFFDVVTPEIYSKSLEVLDLSSTKIGSFDESNIKYLPNLKVINLSYNRISSIEPSTFDNLPNLLAVDLTGNFWKCDQKTIDLFNFLTDKGLTDVIDPVKCITEEGFYQDIYTSRGPVDIFSISLEGFVNDAQPESALESVQELSEADIDTENAEAEQQANVVLNQQEDADANGDNQEEDTDDAIVNGDNQEEDTDDAVVNGDNQAEGTDDADVNNDNQQEDADVNDENQQEDADNADVNDDNQQEDTDVADVNDDNQPKDTDDGDLNNDNQQDTDDQAVDEDGVAESENKGDEDNADEDADAGDNYQDDQYVNDDGLQDENQNDAQLQSLDDLREFLSKDDSFNGNVEGNDETDDDDEESDDSKKVDEGLGDKILEELILEQTGKSNSDVMDAIHKLLKEEEVNEDFDDYGDDYWDNLDDDVKSEVLEQKVEEEAEEEDEGKDVADEAFEETKKKSEDETKQLPDVSENPDDSADMEISVIREDQYIVLLERGSADESRYGIYFTNNFFSTTLGIVMAMVSIMLVLCLLYVARESYTRRRRKEIHGSTNVLINKWSDDLA